MTGTRSRKKALATALGVARAGGYVFPVKTDGTKSPPAGFLWTELSTTDAETIVEWWDGDYAGFEIGLHLGRSGLIAVDLDRHDEGADGIETRRGHDETHPLPATFSYATRNDGEHHLYRDPEPGRHTQRSRVLPGVDVKAGDGYVVYWKKNAPESFDVAPAPEWALIPVSTRGTAEDAFSGSIAAWLDLIPDGKPAKTAKAACKRAEPDGIDHQEMLDIVADVVREATVNPDGMRPLIEAARARYLAHPLAKASMWDKALEGSIRAQGAPGSKRPPRTLPKSMQELALAVMSRPKELMPTNVHATDFLTEKGRFKPATFATMLAPFIAWGADGQTWTWSGSVWQLDDELIDHHVAKVMGDHLELSQVAKVALSLKDGRVPRLSSEPQQDVINLRNCMYYWRTGESVPHDPKQLSTVQLPLDFDRDAECPHFDRWLAEVLDPDAVPLAWEVIAYLLMSGNPFQKAFAFVGTGGNGKSTFIRVLERMMGNENISRVTLRDMAEDKFAPASMFGKLANMVADLEGGFIKDTSIFKMLTGGDTIRVQEKYQKGFTYKPWAVPVFSSNSIIRTNDRSKGFLRRWVTIRFPNEFLEGDLDEGLLMAEVDGIFAKAMRVLPELMERHEFTETMSGEEIQQEMLFASNPVADWVANDPRILAESEKAADDVGVFETKRDLLYDTFRNWSVTSGHTLPLSAGPFYATLVQDPRFTAKKVNGLRVITGIRLTTVFQPQA